MGRCLMVTIQRMPAQFHFLMVISIITLFKCLSISKISMEIVLFLFAYLSYFLYLCIYETGSYGHSQCAEKHEREAGGDAKNIDSQHDTICNLNP